jgi:hypothetical protein
VVTLPEISVTEGRCILFEVSRDDVERRMAEFGRPLDVYEFMSAASVRRLAEILR